MNSKFSGLFFTHCDVRITPFCSAYLIFITLVVIISTVSCTPLAATPTQFRAQTPTLTVSPTSTSTLAPATSIPGTATPTEHRPLLIEICSPLAVLNLDEIPPFITQPFIAPVTTHNAEHPEWVRKDDGHHGVDIGYYKNNGELFTGTPVLAALAGQIAAVIHDRPPYGDMVIVETSFEYIPPALVTKQAIPTSNSLYTLYAHLQNLQTLEIGQPIRCGQMLAETGLTGFTGGPHLHFETRWGPPGQTFKSMAYYRADASDKEMRNYETWRMTDLFHLFDPMALLKNEGGRTKIK